ncbi:hypothetical protein JW848_05385 [Candidatus Bipolaricaulota bacterium]|nr:hypothetical protein [Candidatus Bipolaricaulota bacterium]
MRRRTAALCLAVVLLISWTSTAQQIDERDVNLSDQRGFGIGMQVGLPHGGLLSGRYWFAPAVGVEGIVFLSGDAEYVDGQITGRVLYRSLDADVVDLYLAAGVSLPLAGEGFSLSALAGIEFGLRFAPHLAWNLEFGMFYGNYGVGMAVGAGIHIYFGLSE